MPHYFIYNKNHPNLKIITGHFVKRVLFEYAVYHRGSIASISLT